MRGSGGARIEWSEMPRPVRAALEEALGAAVVEATNQPGGFSPGLAARCQLADGRRAFVKAVSPDQNPHSPRVHRREAEVAALVRDIPHAPRLRHVHDDGHWVALVFDEVEGRQPSEPWDLDELDLVIHAIRDFTRAVTPSPAGLQTVAERHRHVFRGWRRLAAGDGDPDGFPSWVRDELAVLVSVERTWEEAAEGTSLVHADLRADNVLLTPGGGVVLVDWPWACIGADFVDLAFLLPSVGLGDGPDVATVIDRYDLMADVDADQFRAVFVAVAGYLARSAIDPTPPGLPRIRAFQRAQADVALDWLENHIP